MSHRRADFNFQIVAVVNTIIFIRGVVLQNVDANAAKDLMAHLVDLQSNLDDVNKYSFPPIFRILLFVCIEKLISKLQILHEIDNYIQASFF